MASRGIRELPIGALLWRPSGPNEETKVVEQMKNS
jgi:hypothetical protein